MRIGVLLVMAAAVLAPGAARAQDAPKPPPKATGLRRSKAFADAVSKSIDRGAQWLRGLQQGDGSWAIRPIEAFWVTGAESLGPTALALYTLRACGAPPDDPAVKRGFQRLRERWVESRRSRRGLDSYGVALTILALEAQYAADAAPAASDPEAAARPASSRIPEADLDWLKELTRWLVQAQKPEGGFSYWSPAQGAEWDHSNVQFALLALKAARRCGVEVPRDLWKRAMEHLLDYQEKKGPPVGRFEPGSATDGSGHPVLYEVAKDHARGWGYARNMPATGSMTAGCVSSLVICRSELLGTGAHAAEQDRRAVQGIRDGVAWLGLHFTVSGNPGPAGAPAMHEAWHYYYLYGLERAGVLSGLVLFEQRDWYLEGAQLLLDEQRDNGSWFGQAALEALPAKEMGPEPATANFLDTCFALLFLKRATFTVDRGAVATDAADGNLNLEGADALDDDAFGPLFDAVFARFLRAEGQERDVRAADFVRIGVRSIPLLLRRLEAEDAKVRAAAIRALECTTGTARGYAADAPAGERGRALAAWEEWWITAKAGLAADPAAGKFIEKAAEKAK
jgi:hypothetical protein